VKKPETCQLFREKTKYLLSERGLSLILAGRLSFIAEAVPSSKGLCKNAKHIRCQKNSPFILGSYKIFMPPPIKFL